MISPSVLRTTAVFRFSLLIIVATLVAGADAWGQVNGAIGLEGKVRTSRWTQLTLAGLDVGQEIIVESIDGDGVRFQSQHAVNQSPTTVYLPAGPQGAAVEVRLSGEDGKVGETVWRTRLLDGVVSGDQPWFVALGDPLGLDQIGSSQLLGVAGSVAVSKITAAEQLPDHWIGYHGVDLVIVSGDSLPVLSNLNALQQTALEQWVLHGGRIFVSFGENGEAMLASASWLKPLLAIEGPVTTVTAQPAAIETFIAARNPIEPFVATQFESKDATVILAGRTGGRDSLPLVFSRDPGFGKVTVFMGGLQAEPLASWKQRTDFMTRILPDLIPARREGRTSLKVGGDVRYQELVGQVRSTLDQFAAAGRVPFSAIAAVILCLVGMIGPLDYFLVNRWLGKPLLGWLSFPLMIVAFSAAILVLRGNPVGTSVRQVSIVDIDPATHTGRGFSWMQVFSAEATRGNFQVVADGPLGQPTNGQPILSPWGFAGREFGGIEIAGEDVRLPSYQLRIVPELQQSPLNASASRMQQVPLAPQSSKALVANWHFSAPLEVSSQLARRQGSDLLDGSLQNPLPVDLLDGYLVYRNLIYALPTRVAAGSTLANLESIQPKNFRWKLNRRIATEESSASERWDVADTTDLNRLMEIVLFHDAAGGEKYTGLTNRTLQSLDLSSLLTEERAILVGRCEANLARLTIETSDDQSKASEQQTYVRILLPVDTTAGRSPGVLSSEANRR